MKGNPRRAYDKDGREIQRPRWPAKWCWGGGMSKSTASSAAATEAASTSVTSLRRRPRGLWEDRSDEKGNHVSWLRFVAK